jgi:hypothetical protein
MQLKSDFSALKNDMGERKRGREQVIARYSVSFLNPCFTLLFVWWIKIIHYTEAQWYSFNMNTTPAFGSMSAAPTGST